MRRLVFAAVLVVMLGASLSALAQDAVAEVDGQKITRQEYYDRLERLPYTDPATGQPNEAGAAVLGRLIKEKLILKLADNEEVTPTEQQVQERMDWTMKTPGFRQQMEASGYTTEQFKERMWVEQAAFNIQTKGITVTNAEARALYGKNYMNPPFTRREQAVVGALFLKDKADTDKAQALLEKGVDFGTVAAQLSSDPVSAKNGGQLGRPIIRGDQNIPKEIQEMVFKTKLNECTKPIPAGNGSVIFEILTHQPKKVLPFSEFQHLIKQRLAVEKGMVAGIDINKKVEELRQSAKIDVGIERYKTMILGPPRDLPDEITLPIGVMPRQE